MRGRGWLGNGIGIVVNAPKIFYGFDEFNFDVSFHAPHIATAYRPAGHFTSIRIREDKSLPDGQIIGATKDSPIVEHNDGLAFFPNRLDRAAHFGRGTPDREAHFETDRIGTSGLAVIVLRIPGRLNLLAWAV